MKILNKILFKKRVLPVYIDLPLNDIESDIDKSFRLLKTAAAEVSAAAVSAAETLQEKLNASKNRFFWTIDSIEDLVLVKDGNGCWKTLNKFGQTIFNMHHGEYVGKTDLQLIEEFPSFKESLMVCLKSDTEAWDIGRASRFKEVIPRGDDIYHFDVIKTPTFHPDGTRRELIIIGRDVTEVTEKSKRERACFQALNSASDAIMIMDKNAHVYFCNDQFVTQFNLENYQEIIGLPLKQILPEFPQYNQMWESVHQNIPWSIQCLPQQLDRFNKPCACPVKKTNCDPDNCLSFNIQIHVLPMMNGQVRPIYYVCTFKTKCFTDNQ